ncbi:SusC/RagA family TonB-linked outer membrane protein [Autumnicola musiva]|uniref:SusC/RagA family TonB-linked outer membrane protein n=1 Tax=Autumnicola musiva TaxID=3075589 RepID=A0ABU3D1P5_9FLAO|nr:SusC/RagA family TonB-linked outer membrane protein [Zunongwangia sp. F117]MDT0675458.1 SusC/RagA family TonB-linked outer membrane protein [Zunongwangia sp. F117]
MVKKIFFLLCIGLGLPQIISAQEQTVSGIVTEVGSGMPLPGVTVMEKRTSNGTSTDFNGDFSLAVGENTILVFSMIGYETQEVPVTSGELNVEMQINTEALDEVVVTALGIKREERALAYNVQEIESQEIVQVKDANFINSLAGKVAGVNISTSSTGIGGSARVVMRGTKSISGNNNALYVVDGIPLPSLQSDQPSDIFSGAGQTGDGISIFNPEDIESVTVLSGPAAAALYGSAAANGVVMVTTKSGQEEGMTVNFSNNTTFFSPFVLPDFQNLYGVTEAGSYSSWGDELSEPSSYDPTDFFQTGFNVTNSVSISTGTDKNQTYFSASSVAAEGIINNNNLDRYNFSFRNTSNFLDDKLSMDITAMYMYTEEQNMLAQGQYFNPLIPIYLFPPGRDIRKYQVFERYNPTRNFQTQYWPFGDQGFQMQNPYWITQRNIFNNDKNRYLMSGSLNYDIYEGISITGRVKFDRNNALNERKYYASTAGLFAGENGAYYRQNADTRQLYTDVIMNMNKQVEDFSISANIGASLQDVEYDFSTFGGNLQGVPNLFALHNINLNQAETLQNGYHDQTQAIFATAQVGYKNMAFLDVSARNDWVSALANTDANSIFYPSVGLSAIVSDLFDFNSDTFSYLKARASYSEVGNAPQRYISIATYPVINGYPQTSTFLPATGLEPERTESFEVGINARLWNRLKIDLTAYTSSTYNQLFNPSLSSSSGYDSFYVNAGQIDNKGIELSVGYDQEFGDLKWSSNLTYSLNRNKIEQLLPSYTIEETGETVSLDSLNMGGTGSYRMILTEGGSMGDIYVNTLRRDAQGYIYVNPMNYSVSPDQERFVKAGNSNPDYMIGFRNSFEYKGFNLGFLVNARVGGEVVSVTQAIMDAYGVSEASAQARDDGGVLVNGFRVPSQSYYQVVGGGTSGIGSRYVYSATNVRLAEVSLGYNLDFENKFLGLKNLNFSLIGRNLFMFYNKAPFDPQATANTGTYYQGVDYFMQPSLQGIGFSVRGRF